MYSWSHPTRGAWIEIMDQVARGKQIGRTPHGVRGLKSPTWQQLRETISVAPHTGCVD